MSLREQVAHAIGHGNLTQSDREETSADLIGALAMADPLGAALWRVTGNLDPVAFRSARAMLIDRFTGRAHPTLLFCVCQQVLEEWLACLCPACDGRAFVANEAGVREACKECKGTGRGRASHEVRMAALHVGSATYSKLTGLFDEVHSVLNTADRKVSRQISDQLERKSAFFQGKI